MAFSRRLFLTSSLSGAGILLLSACTEPAPKATRSLTPTTPIPSPTEAGIRPSAFARSSWGTDPYAFGAFSFLTEKSTDSDRAILRRPLHDKLFFAGEAVASADPGTVVGAHTSGLEVAAAVAEVAKKGERIAVIGAGMAGATAARTLADRGYDVVVIEARHRIGGRIASLISDEWPIEVQVGAAVLRGDGAPALGALLAEAGVTTVPLDDTSTARIGSTSTPFPDTVVPLEALQKAFVWAEKRSSEETVTQALIGSGAEARVSTHQDATGVSDAERLAFLLDEVLPVQFGAEARTLSARALDPPPIPMAGSLVTKGFTSWVTTQLADLDVLRGSNVTQIDYGNQGIGLRFATGESLSADRVVSTIPLGVLQHEKVVFSPPLPSAQLASIHALGMGVQDVLWLRFEQRLWSTDETVWAVLDEGATYRLWLNLEPSTGYPILVALIGGSAATRAEKLSDDEAVDAAMSSIAAYLDVVPSTLSPSPTPPQDPSATPAS